MTEPRPHHVAFVVFDGIQTLDLTGPHDVFAGANAVLADVRPDAARYHSTVVSLTGGPVTSESGLQVVTQPVAGLPDRIGTLAIPGGSGTRAASNDPAMVDAVADLARRADRTIAICTGAFVVAATGLLDRRRATTHWARSEALARRFPLVDVDDDPIYLRDGDVWTSAGVTAGIDLALAVVEHDHGTEVAQTVARWLVMFLRRPGGQSQFAAPVWTERAELEPVRHAQDLIDATPGDDHRIPVLAERVGMSERHFTRRFTEQIGVTPAQYIASVRLEAARRALETTTETTDVIAARCGFGTAETMRRTFARRLSTSPDQYRRRFRRTSPERSPA
ncbi:MAG: GlxA family transcriptional regulator [Ilumatobacteraceae bacterium]|nr:GlxA family transcriptional regulator [Ilumatobacteraceae bacterium]